ncbi:DNA mismatch repair protein MutS [Alkalinema sp. FACHB-956]|uniref:DNA mismatch repair protein MutS n=1 Tax=Alkalinema sp. FACHB-956 TaxID=2692768 RepID=UPI001689E660|nr:DNA mismatch repair protein MutS [Alkalinema sp. FACHB-956]MBD2327361.1 DNA mismatch repair protein MutS [Alkalinema sp. FACHB-956]
MSQLPPDSSNAIDPTQGLPERLIKHAVKYADHRSVDRDSLTPMMRHYADMKDQYPQALLLYRVGDFFETFFQDAVTIARELELVLTSKDGGKEVGRVPLAGIPHHALDRYCAQLVEKGFAIAVCDQVEDPAEAQGTLVRREVTRVITPGTLLEEGMLNARRNNFLAAVVVANQHWGLAYADISTGEFFTTQATGLEQLTHELQRLQPAEVLYPTNAPDLVGLLRPGEKNEQIPSCLPPQFCYTLRPQSGFVQAEARNRLLQRFRMRSLEAMGCETLPLAVRAAGGLLEYLETTSERQWEAGQTQVKVPLQLLATYTLTEFLVLDGSTRRNLEITQTQRDGTFHGSLLWALDRTITPMGSRALRRWLQQPLLDRLGIAARQDTIRELVDDGLLREDIQKLLRQIYDLERLAGRAGSGTATPRDLVALADSLEKLPALAALVAQAKSPYLQVLQTVPPILEELAQLLRSHLVEKPPLSLTEGGLIRPGVNLELDDRRQQVEQDQQWISSLELTEREKTGISTLKVGYNKTFGYYLSISRNKADQVPPDYIRKQTLTNEERYITPDLKECENRLLTAKEELGRLEYEIFVSLRSQVGEQAEEIRQVARAVAAADVLAGLAEVAVYQGYCCPEMTDDRTLVIQAGRHPVVEQSLPAGFFVPNSTTLGQVTDQRPSQGQKSQKSQKSQPAEATAPDLIILTGPNASGKSCYLRQVGLIQLMAQVGSFVPAQSARLGICDRIFTRVGAVDDLAMGQSTFMVEMNETANILNHASDRSLVLLDEIGRGTATFDGLSIAWAVAEYLAQEITARTIFATHYHELNELASILSNVANYQVTVKELPDQIVFLHQVQPGGADRSYGIEAGRLAGLPPSVITRAKQVMGQIEQHSKIAVGLRQGPTPQTPETKAPRSRKSAIKPSDRADRVSDTAAPDYQLDIFGN